MRWGFSVFCKTKVWSVTEISRLGGRVLKHIELLRWGVFVW